MTKQERLKAAEAAYPEFPNEPKGETRYNRDIHCHKKRKAFIKGAEAEAESKWVEIKSEADLPDNNSNKFVILNGDKNASHHVYYVAGYDKWHKEWLNPFGDKIEENVTHWQNIQPLNQQ